MLNKPSPIATSGERFFFNRIDQIYSESDALVGYIEPDIVGLHPDFLLLSPSFGVVLAEIKDFSPNMLVTIAKTGTWEKLDENNNKVSIGNPFDQLYQYWRAVKDRVNYSHFPKNIDIPIVRIAVFSQVSRDGETAEKIRQVAPNKIQLCFKETLARNESFKNFLEDILPVNYNLSKKHFLVLRANLIPTCRLPTPTQSDLMKYFSPEDKIKLLDLEQERLARRLGEGHRLIFGVAGSGKTVLLIARARYLAKQHPDWKILILCYNRLLRKSLFNLLNPQDYEADITISTFHSWVRKYILCVENEFSRLYEEANERANREDKLDEFFQKVVPKLFLKLLDDLGDERILYDAILIDEAQDFEDNWFRAIVEVLNPKTNSLLITCDGLQGIYERKKFRWVEVGIKAPGRVRKFAKTYRTPIEIGVIAQKALPNTLRHLLDKYDEYISTKEYAGQHGTVEIILSDSRDEEYKKLTEKIQRLVKQPQEILVLFRYNMEKINYDHPFFKELTKLNIEWKELKDHNYNTPGLIIGTIHGSKGLECDTIIIPEVNLYRSGNQRQLLYVGITRSLKKLILSAHKSTLLLKDLESSQNAIADSTNRTQTGSD